LLFTIGSIQKTLACLKFKERNVTNINIFKWKCL